MKQLNSDLRMEYQQLATPELETLLEQELDKQTPDDDTVLTLLHILKDREPVLPLMLSAGEQKALERYQQKRARAGRRKSRFRRLLPVAASLLLLLTVLFSVTPQKAEAETFWEMLQRITSTVLEYFNPREAFDEAERSYVFKTDHPGLQKVYDAAVEMGVTIPAVPMWLPEGSKLIDLKLTESPLVSSIYACFSYGTDEIVYRLNLYAGQPAHQYYKDDTHYEYLERNGTTYHITRNNDRWVAVWELEQIECLLTLDCQEDTLRSILKSIYVTEVE